MPDLITPDLVALDADLGSDKSTVVRRLAGLVAGTGRATSADGLADDALAREAQAATGLPGGIAIPHCRSAAVTEASRGRAGRAGGVSGWGRGVFPPGRPPAGAPTAAGSWSAATAATPAATP